MVGTTLNLTINGIEGIESGNIVRNELPNLRATHGVIAILKGKGVVVLLYVTRHHTSSKSSDQSYKKLFLDHHGIHIVHCMPRAVQ